ncbi:MAG: glycoside hydrolase family 97 N-terminal domain-containing protein, partial [Ferruginibacter sp.]
MNLKIKIFIAVLSLAANSFAQNVSRLQSPDGNIVFSFRLINSLPVYSVDFKKSNLVSSSLLNLDAGNGGFKKIIIDKTIYSAGIDNYELVVGKTKRVNDQYNQLIISMEDKGNNSFKTDLEIRAFNDGIAFRYRFPLQNSNPSFSLFEELTQFRFSSDPIVKALLLPNYTSSHEGLYTALPLSELKEDTLMDMPSLFEFPNQIFVAITEAALVDYAG